MNAFKTHKTFPQNLAAIVAALVLAMGLSAAPFAAAQAEDMPEQMGAVEFSYGSQNISNQDLNELRELLSLPELSDAQRLRLELSLESMDEEMADASEATSV